MTPAGSISASAADVILRDGSTLRLHAPGGEDAEGLVEFFARLSARSRYLRFHGARSVDHDLVTTFLEPDWATTGALIGRHEARIVALASYARLRDPAIAEVAFAVADQFQGRGVGTRLLERLAERAAAVGVERFVAEVLAENTAMLGVFRDAGFEVTRSLAGGEVEVQFPIAATETFRAQVEDRDHIAVAASLRPFFAPGSVVVIGASRRRGSIGGELFRNILVADFAGAVYPLNRTGEPVAGVRAATSITELPEVPDLAVICVPAAQVVDAAETALDAGVHALCVISSGFAEVGGEGAARQEELLARVRSHGGRMIGPNCLGISVPALGLNATFAPRQLPAGRIAFSSQSGALGLALLEKATERRLGFSAFVSIGNKADVSSNDLLEWWEEDEQTDVVLLYLESFGNPRKFGRLARRVARKKPILALKAGTTSAGARAASSHTAALAGAEVAVDALFQQAGVLRARTLEELVDAATFFSAQPLPAGRRVAVVTNAGGLGILCADACEAAGLTLPELAAQTREALASVLPAEASSANPVDLLGSATAATYEAALPLVLDDPGIDSAIVLFVPPVVARAEDVVAAITRVAERESLDKPLLAVVVSAEGTPPAFQGSTRVAAFPYPESAARTLGLAVDRAEWLRRPLGAEPKLASLDAAAGRASVESALADGKGWLGPAQARAVLEAYGIPLLPERIVATVDEAVAAAVEFGYPVVVKTARAGAHKTELGGVALGLDRDKAVREAGERIGPPLLVQPMVAGAVEFLAGVVQDPVFGPLVAFGPGGVMAELIGGAGFRIAPLTDVDARELVHGGKAGELVRGFRGRPAVDSAALTELLHRLARLAEDLPEIAELDLNPILASGERCVAVDARIRVAPPLRAERAKSW
jgi:acetyl coenzyme A synthetase (ADP forming)-like protein